MVSQEPTITQKSTTFATEKQARWTRWYEAAKQNPEWRARRRASKAASHLRRKAAGKKRPPVHREKARERWRRFYLRHLDAERERSHNKPSERTKAAWHRYHQRHYARYLAMKTASEQKRRAQKAGSVIEPIDYEAICHAANGLCGICHEPIGNEPTHFDHIVPLATGGAHVQTNLQLAHAICNIRKGARSQPAA